MSSYIVNWHRADGQPGWHPVADVQEATRFVEHLRNAESVEVTRIYRLDEVAFEFKPYFRVELATAPGSFAARIPPEPHPEPMQAHVAVDPDPAPTVEVEPEPEPEPAVEPDLVPVSAPSWSTTAEAIPEPDSANGSARRGLFGR